MEKDASLRRLEQTAAAARRTATRCAQNLEPIADEISTRASSFGRASRAQLRRMSAVVAESGSEVADRAKSFGTRTAGRSLSFGRRLRREQEPPPPPPLTGPTVPADVPWASHLSNLPPPPANLWSNQQSSLGSIAGTLPSPVPPSMPHPSAAADQTFSRRREARHQRRRTTQPDMASPPSPPPLASVDSAVDSCGAHTTPTVAAEPLPLSMTKCPSMTKRESRELLAMAEVELQHAKAELGRQRSKVEEMDASLVGAVPSPAEPQHISDDRPISEDDLAVAVGVLRLAAQDPAAARRLRDGWAAAGQRRPLPEALINICQACYELGAPP